MAHLPLLLDGSAFLVFDQLSAEDRKKTAAVKAALEAAFAPSPAESYHLFVGRQLALDEPVDAYVADLTRLLTLSGHKVAADGKDPLLVEQLICGLPQEYGKTVRLANAMKSLTVAELTGQVRTMQSAVSQHI